MKKKKYSLQVLTPSLTFVDFPFLIACAVFSIIFASISSYELTHAGLASSSLLNQNNISRFATELAPLIQGEILSVLKNFKYDIHGRIFLLSFWSFFIPLISFHIFAKLLFQNNRQMSVRIFSILNVLVFYILSYIIQLKSHDINLPVFQIISTSIYESIRAIHIASLAMFLIFKLITNAQSRIAKSIRIILLIAAIASAILIDLEQTRKARTIAQTNNVNAVHRQRFVLFVPNFSPTHLDRILENASLSSLKEKLKVRLPLLPTSDSETVQVASIITGMLPFQSGIRSDFAPPYELNELKKNILEYEENANKVSNATFKSRVIGALHPAASFLTDENKAINNCNISIQKSAFIAALEKNLFAISLTPNFLLFHFYPEVQCSNLLVNNTEIIQYNLNDATTILSKTTSLTHFLFLTPPNVADLKNENKTLLNKFGNPDWQKIDGNENTYRSGPWMPQTPSEFKDGQLDNLVQSFATYDNFIRLLNLESNADFYVIGLAGSNGIPGVLALFSKSPSANLVEMNELGVLVGQAQLSPLWAGKNIDRNQLLYFESLRFNATDKINPAAEDRRFSRPLMQSVSIRKYDEEDYLVLDEKVARTALNFAPRSILCPYKNELSPPGMLQTLRINHGNLENIVHYDIPGPLPYRSIANSRLECMERNQKEMSGIFASDLTLFPFNIATRANEKNKMDPKKGAVKEIPGVKN